MSEENHEIEKVAIPDEILLQPAYPRAADFRVEGDYGYGYGHKEENVRVREVWRNIRKHKWLVLTITVVITIVVAIEMYRTPSIASAR